MKERYKSVVTFKRENASNVPKGLASRHVSDDLVLIEAAEL